jgi:glyoxylase-like metal-dependent hydrolase (beta-lactamase superfamily II)
MALNGLELQLSTLYQPTECTHMTTVYVPAMKALFAADLVYHKMFPWLGRGVEAAHVHNWMNVLRQLQENYRADAPTIYPGHGSPGRIELLEEQVGFLQNFMAVVESAPSEYEAVATLIRKYPDYYQREFILPSSVSNFMKEGTEPDRKSLANVYAMRNSGGEYRWSAPFRKVL